jgi:Flp pilus assembly protein CpaB
MKNKAFNVLIILALLLGAASLFLIKKYIETEKNKYKVAAPVPQSVKVETAKVLVATNDIPPAKAFDVLSYKVVDMPKPLVPPSALSQASDLNGRLSAYFIPKGDMILRAKAVLPAQLPRASFMIEPGHRIISVPVSELATSGFVVKNGDYVDLVGNFPVSREMLAPGQELFGSVIAVTFMQRVKVVDIFKGEVQAIGDRDTTPKDPAATGTPPAKTSSMGNQGRRLGEGTIATFDVTPEQAELIMGAVKASQGIYLVLRNYDDKEERVISNPMHQRIIAGLKQQQAKQAPPPAAPAPAAQTRKKVL